MTINEYQKNALRTANKSLTPFQQLKNGVMGLNGEAGECIDILKKHLFQGHELDREHIAKELGDIAWYLALSADATLRLLMSTLSWLRRSIRLRVLA